MIRRRILYGGDKVDYSKQYLTIVSLADNNTIKWYCSTSGTSNRRFIQASVDEGDTWAIVQSTSSGTAIAALNKGERMLIRYYSNNTYGGSGFYNYFASTQDFKVEGNVMSLMARSDFESESSLLNYALRSLFRSCTKLKDAENLVLPATSLGGYCYYEMFRDCSGMTKGPKELPINYSGLAGYCYAEMFRDCTSLSETPTTKIISQGSAMDIGYVFQNMFYNCSSIVTAENFDISGVMGVRSHDHMFYNCSSLVTSPYFTWSGYNYGCYYMFANCRALKNIKSPSTIVSSGSSNFWAYMFNNCSSLESIHISALSSVPSSGMNNMFDGCSSLSEIEVGNLSSSSTISISNWVNGVSATGTFYKKAGSTWSNGVNGIPSGWTVIEV